MKSTATVVPVSTVEPTMNDHLWWALNFLSSAEGDLWKASDKGGDEGGDEIRAVLDELQSVIAGLEVIVD